MAFLTEGGYMLNYYLSQDQLLGNQSRLQEVTGPRQEIVMVNCRFSPLLAVASYSTFRHVSGKNPNLLFNFAIRHFYKTFSFVSVFCISEVKLVKISKLCHNR